MYSAVEKDVLYYNMHLRHTRTRQSIGKPRKYGKAGVCIMRFYYFGQFMPVSRLENRTDQRNISSFYFCHVSLYFLDRLPKASVNQISRNFAHLPIPVYCSNTGKPNFQNWLNSTIELHKSGQPLRIVVNCITTLLIIQNIVYSFTYSLEANHHFHYLRQGGCVFIGVS